MKSNKGSREQVNLASLIYFSISREPWANNP